MAKRPQRPLTLLILLNLALGAAYGLANPLFEAPDEHWHYFTAEYIAENWRLPAVGEEPDPWLGQEAAQPPLYYVLSALLIAPFDTDGSRDLVWPNPNAALAVGDASALANRNAFVHGPWEAWPWQGYALAAHLLRFFSTLLGAGTLLFIYESARLLWPEHPRRALLAAALVAFLPQYLFLHSAVSNDPLVILLASAGLYQLLRFWLRGGGWRAALLIGVTAGLAMLSKTAGLLLLGYAVVFVGLAHWRRGKGPAAAVAAALWVVGPALLIGGWLLLRNWQLYGDPTAANQFVRLAGGDRGYSVADVLGESSGLLYSAIAVFGWFNVRAPSWVYASWGVIAGLALAGVALRLVREGAPARYRVLLPALLAGWVLLVYTGLFSFMLRTPAAQGRLLFPALLPLALGLARGLDRPLLRWLAPLLALATALAGVAWVIPAAYRPPPIVKSLPAGVAPLQAQLEQGLLLEGAIIETAVARPGEPVWMQLYWRIGDTTREEAPQRVVELFGWDDQEPSAKQQAYHGSGLFPAPLWPPDGLVAERVGVRLDAGMAAPVAGRVYAGLVGFDTRELLGYVKVIPAAWPEAPAPLAVAGDRLILGDVFLEPQRAAPGATIHMSVTWSVDAPPGRDLTTFVHLGEPGIAPVATGDSPPLEGRYPTSLWARGEVIQDWYTLALPPDLAPGRYPLLLGLYDPRDGSRLPLSVDGERQAHDSYRAGWIEVVAAP
jgi:4-amino-4-deoxy-L-arabinose transferase-like glycosyltransferase